MGVMVVSLQQLYFTKETYYQIKYVQVGDVCSSKKHSYPEKYGK